MFHLKKAETLLGVLEIYGGDFPWHDCNFEPTAAFDEFRPLFDGTTSQGDDKWYQQIKALDLRLVKIINGEEINYFEFGLYIHGHEAKLRL
jgi:hypothetical protein